MQSREELADPLQRLQHARLVAFELRDARALSALDEVHASAGRDVAMLASRDRQALGAQDVHEPAFHRHEPRRPCTGERRNAQESGAAPGRGELVQAMKRALGLRPEDRCPGRNAEGSHGITQESAVDAERRVRSRAQPGERVVGEGRIGLLEEDPAPFPVERVLAYRKFSYPRRRCITIVSVFISRFCASVSSFAVAMFAAGVGMRIVPHG